MLYVIPIYFPCSKFLLKKFLHSLKWNRHFSFVECSHHTHFLQVKFIQDGAGKMAWSKSAFSNPEGLSLIPQGLHGRRNNQLLQLVLWPPPSCLPKPPTERDTHTHNKEKCNLTKFVVFSRSPSTQQTKASPMFMQSMASLQLLPGLWQCFQNYFQSFLIEGWFSDRKWKFGSYSLNSHRSQRRLLHLERDRDLGPAIKKNLEGVYEVSRLFPLNRTPKAWEFQKC